MSLSPDFIHELKKHFTGEICAPLGTRILHSNGASTYQIEPGGIMIPRPQGDVQAAVESGVVRSMRNVAVADQGKAN